MRGIKRCWNRFCVDYRSGHGLKARDTNAALNMRLAFWALVYGEGRPEHLAYDAHGRFDGVPVVGPDGVGACTRPTTRFRLHTLEGGGPSGASKRAALPAAAAAPGDGDGGGGAMVAADVEVVVDDAPAAPPAEAAAAAPAVA